MIRNISLFVLWFFVWLLLTWPPDYGDVATAVIAAAFVSLVTFDILNGSGKSSKLKNPFRYLWLVWYFVVFLWECLKANIDVAWRVACPDIPISPGTVKIKVDLKSDLALTFLANSVTLTPGTTSVDIDKDKGVLYVHWLCVDKSYVKDKTKFSRVERFENILKKVFD